MGNLHDARGEMNYTTCILGTAAVSKVQKEHEQNIRNVFN